MGPREDSKMNLVSKEVSFHFHDSWKKSYEKWDFVFVWKKAIPTCDHLQKLLNILHAPMKLEHLSAFGLNELVGHCLTIPVP